MIKSHDPQLDAQDLRFRLVKSATTLGEQTQTGYGLVNAWGAVQMGAGASSPPVEDSLSSAIYQNGTHENISVTIFADFSIRMSDLFL